MTTLPNARLYSSTAAKSPVRVKTSILSIRLATRVRCNWRLASVLTHREDGLRFRSEFFNHPNFGSPNNTLSSPLFGHSMQILASFLGSGGANGGFNPLYQISGPRSIQLALQLQF